ncbi:MAG: hypothetical protein J5770_04250 [Bacteroidaceae bacterium]|nr:hypothetical protein [Bacteroidaceae bacterium]
MNYDLNRIKQLLKLYDEAKTTDAEEAELADFFRTATDIPEDLQDYAVLFSVLDSADTLFNNEDSTHGSGNSKGWWWAIGIAAAIIVIMGLFLWSNDTTDEVLPNRASGNPTLSAHDTTEYVTGPPMPVVSQEVTNQVAEVKEIRVAEAKIERIQKPSQVKPEQIAIVEDTTSTQPAEELLAEETSQSEQTTDSHSQSVRFGALPTGSTSKGFGGGYVGGSGGFGNGLIMTHVDSMLIGRVAGMHIGRVAGADITTTGKKGKYITMRGYVTDEEKQPIANARIMVVGVPSFVYTDKNGFFEARLNNALRIQVVCEGYETKQNIKPKKKMKIKLKKNDN